VWASVSPAGSVAPQPAHTNASGAAAAPKAAQLTRGGNAGAGQLVDARPRDGQLEGHRPALHAAGPRTVHLPRRAVPLRLASARVDEPAVQEGRSVGLVRGEDDVGVGGAAAPGE